jgi:hypothetical protein
MFRWVGKFVGFFISAFKIIFTIIAVLVVVIIPKLLISPVAALKKRMTDYYSKRPDKATLETVTNKLVIWTRVLAVVGIFSLFASGLQWCALLRTDETTREAFTAVQRAFVNVSELKIEKGKILPGPPGNPGTSESAWWFTPMIQNTGNTPTKNMHFLPIAWCGPPGFTLGPMQAFGCEATPLPPTDPDNFFQDRSTGHAVLGPHSIIPIGGVGIPVPAIESLGIAQRTTGGEWFVFGAIHYNDIFPYTREHVTKYCFVINANNFVLGEIQPAYGLCKHWNCVDDECVRDKEDYEAESRKATVNLVR